MMSRITLSQHTHSHLKVIVRSIIVYRRVFVRVKVNKPVVDYGAAMMMSVKSRVTGSTAADDQRAKNQQQQHRQQIKSP